MILSLMLKRLYSKRKIKIIHAVFWKNNYDLSGSPSIYKYNFILKKIITFDNNFLKNTMQ